uniref:Uncharacterized protein n=1 Tax=Romanomermis culicivorax TaxID=13658 RepID=A0A915J6A5_ROMCU
MSYFFDQVRSANNEPRIADLKMLAKTILHQMPRLETPGNGRTVGYLHGFMFSALPDKYYHRALTANYQSIHIDSGGMLWYLPTTVQSPDEHLLVDSDPPNINKHIGYDVFDHLTNVNPDTKITEVRFMDNENHLEPLSKKSLQWSIDNLAQNLHTNILLPTPSDAQALMENIEYYLGKVNKFLTHDSIKCNLQSLKDVKAFLIGTCHPKLNKNVKISKSIEQVVDALFIEHESQFDIDANLLTTFGVNKNAIQGIHMLISRHAMNHIAGMNFQFDNGQISF